MRILLIVIKVALQVLGSRIVFLSLVIRLDKVYSVIGSLLSDEERVFNVLFDLLRGPQSTVDIMDFDCVS